MRQTRDRFSVGEVTRTDVAQSESRLAAARAQMLTAESNYTTSRSTYRQVIGVEPGTLAPASPVDRLSPRILPQGDREARARHPTVTTAMFNVDAAVFQVKIAESSLYPTLNLVGSAQKTYGSHDVADHAANRSAASVRRPVERCRSIRAAPNTRPIRQAKETLAASAASISTPRATRRSRRWCSPGDSSKPPRPRSRRPQTQVNAAEIALNGVREEARVGQRTTLDVLNAQQELVNARVSLVTAQRDRVVGVLCAAGRGGRAVGAGAGAAGPIYDPTVHYHQVRDTWVGRAHA